MHKYKVLKKLGEGSYGKVFLVQLREDGEINNILKGISPNDRSNNKKKYYVLKKIDLRKLSQKEKEFSFQELSLLKFLKHPFLIRYKDAFLKNKVLHLIMNFCSFGDLENFIKKNYRSRSTSSQKYYSTKEIFFMFYQLLLSLNYLHNQKIIHRDIKTQNVFLKSRLSIQLGDFGICKIVDENHNFLTNTLIGTPFVMSPEQIISSEKYSFKSDCWSLGIVLFEMLFSKNPIEVFYKSKCTSINNLLNEIKNKRKSMILFNSSTFKSNKYIRSNKHFSFFLKKLCQKNKRKRWDTFDCLNYLFTRRFFKLNQNFFYDKELVEKVRSSSSSQAENDDDDDNDEQSSRRELNYTLNQKNINFKNLKLQLLKLNLYFEEEKKDDEGEVIPSNKKEKEEEESKKKKNNNLYRPSGVVSNDIHQIDRRHDRLEDRLQKLNALQQKLVNPPKRDNYVSNHNNKENNNNNYNYQQQQPQKERKRAVSVPVHNIGISRKKKAVRLMKKNKKRKMMIVKKHKKQRKGSRRGGAKIKKNNNNNFDYLENNLPVGRRYGGGGGVENYISKPKSVPKRKAVNRNNNMIDRKKKKKFSHPNLGRKIVVSQQQQQQQQQQRKIITENTPLVPPSNNSNDVVDRKIEVIEEEVAEQEEEKIVVLNKKKKKKKKKNFPSEKKFVVPGHEDDDDDDGRIIKENDDDDKDDGNINNNSSTTSISEDDEGEGKVVMVEDSVVSGFSSSESETDESDDEGDDDGEEDKSPNSNNDDGNEKIVGSLERRFSIQRKNCLDIFGQELFQKIYDLFKEEVVSSGGGAKEGGGMLIRTSTNKLGEIREILEGKDFLLEFVCLVEELCFIEKSL